ncbi:hypothetical protein A6854_23975, partial [Salmonella enterica]|nr:hypothetical protein [Salmonella enterica]EBS5851967.1 hypothetical protein [Salmonella enterica subsp. enterica serovar Cerro]EBZ2514052.1 hypothetical protein [Salmonella enterica subsp. enterica serovar Cerro]ECH8213926.1 hypothetical protein [Salmonella enterica subsp. enterica serovar Cerro]
MSQQWAMKREMLSP